MLATNSRIKQSLTLYTSVADWIVGLGKVNAENVVNPEHVVRRQCGDHQADIPRFCVSDTDAAELANCFMTPDTALIS